MKFKLSLIILGIVGCAFFMQSCSDDDDVAPYRSFKFENLKGEAYSEGNSVSVTSEKGPQKGQKHRSSNNFSTSSLQGSKGAPNYMVVSCPDKVTFDLNVDKSGTDEVYDNDVYNGAILPYRNSDKFYIANPSGASSSFTVKFTAVYLEGAGMIVSSPGRVREGQSHRASLNFTLPYGGSRFKVHCTNPSVVFGIFEDVTAASDNRMASQVTDGDYINRSRNKDNYYITEPSNANGPFQVYFEPVEVEWMSELDDNLSVADISIPGTHDTGTYALEPINFGESKCQNFNIDHQLQFGIRYFDLRVDASMNITHGGLPCNVSFDEVVKSSTDFLKAHNREFIIFEITGDEDFHAKFNSYLTGNPTLASYFWKNNYVPKLSEVRGKIMIIRRYECSTTEGLDFFTSGVWPDDTSKSGTNPDGVVYNIEDRYFKASSTDDHDTHEKKDKLYEAIDYKLSHPGTLSIAFSSISFSVSHTPYEFMWGGGLPAVSPRMCDVLEDKLIGLIGTKSPVGIIVMDYFNANGHDDVTHITELIIDTNFYNGNMPFVPSRLHSCY